MLEAIGWFLVSGFWFLVSRFWFLVSRFSFLVSRFSFLVSDLVAAQIDDYLKNLNIKFFQAINYIPISATLKL
jgi:hypothetical protein